MLAVLTRGREQDAELARRLEEAGLGVLYLPIISYEKLEEGYSALQDAILEPWDWVVLTSPTAARYFIGAWYLAGAPEVRVAAVGERTREVLEGQGLEVAFVPSRAEGAALAAELPGGGRVLWPTSARAGRELEKTLRERGFAVRRLDVYTLRPRRPTEEERARAVGADLVLFGSPSAVSAWVEAGLSRLPVAAVGRTTGQRAEELGFSPVRWPERPGTEGWVDAALALARELAG